MRLTVEKNGLCLVFELEKGKPVLLLHMGVNTEFEEPTEGKEFLYTMQEIQGTGESRLEHLGIGPSGTFPGNRMYYVEHEESENTYGSVLAIITKDDITVLKSRMVYQFYNDIPVVRCWNEVTNEGNRCRM